MKDEDCQQFVKYQIKGIWSVDDKSIFAGVIFLKSKFKCFLSQYPVKS